MLDVAQVSNIPDYFVQSTLLLYGRRVDLDLEDAHREVCPPVCRVQVVLSIIRHIQVRPEYYFVIQYYLLLRLLIFTIIDYCIIRHVQVRPESMNILWNKRNVCLFLL